MKIIIYCQHVLGIGHLFRTIEICKALHQHAVILVTGGPPVATTLPQHVREFRLPQLQMDHNFKGLHASRPDMSLDQVKNERRNRLLALFEAEKPDLFIVELYPFGRKAFRFELDPVLERIRKNKASACSVVCSVRDILVEKENQEKHETRAVKTLNNFFDAVLVHSDPEIVKISTTFHKYNEIRIPVAYTGFIAQKPLPAAKDQLRRQLDVNDDELLVIASAGGGNVGAPLLEAVIRAFKRLKINRQIQLLVFTGPFLDRDRSRHLQQLADKNIRVAEFATNFISLLTVADLSVSMAGYNTSMNILVSRVPALVWPFPQNREQSQRARRLAHVGALQVLTENDLQPQQLSEIMDRTLAAEHHPSFEIDLEGAQNTVTWVEKLAASRACGGNESQI